MSIQRLHVPDALSEGADLHLMPEQAHYLANVIRLPVGGSVLVFNGREGEWLAHRAEGGKRDVRLTVERQTRPQTPPGRVDYAFAPLKHARLDYMVQKAVEMGARRLSPVLTRFTQVNRLNLERMTANAVEAAEQCGILSLPQVDAPLPLADWLAALAEDRLLVFCDEGAPVADPVAALAGAPAGDPVVLVGPEGGFSPDERALLRAHPRCLVLSIGPRILRADTAAVAALALVQAVRGDLGPHGASS